MRSVQRWSLRSVAQVLAGTCLLGLWPGAGLARPGDHVRLGDAELTPQLLLGTQYRTNVYLVEADPKGGVALLLVPSAALKLDGQDVDVDAAAGYELRKYFDPALTNLDRFRDGNLGIDVGLLPDSVVGADIQEQLDSSSRESEAWYAESNALIQHLRNDLSAELAIHPGAALESGVGGHFLFDDYNVPKEANVEYDANYNSRLAYGPQASFKWRFFPRTAVVLDTSMEWFNWTHNLINIQDEQGQSQAQYGEFLGLPNGWLFSVRGGLRGRFTERVTLGLVAGYNDGDFDEQTVVDAAGEAGASGVDIDPVASGFDKDPEGAQKLALEASVQYDLSETHKVTLGYDRGLSGSYFTNYLVHDYVFLRYNVMLGTRFGVSAEGGYRLESFHGEVTRSDHVVRTRGNFAYAANQWLRAGVNATWDRRASVGHENAAIEYDDVGVGLTLTAIY